MTITNHEIEGIKKALNTLYKTYILDHKYVFNYLKDITDKSTHSNKFNEFIQDLFIGNIDESNPIIINSVSVGTFNNNISATKSSIPDTYNDNAKMFIQLVDIFYIIYSTLLDLLNTNAKSSDLLNTLTEVDISYFENDSYAEPSDDFKKITFKVDTRKITGTFDTRNFTLNQDGIGSNLVNKSQIEYISSVPKINTNYSSIIFNHLYYILNMSSINAKVQLNTIIHLYRIVKEIFYFRALNEILFDSNLTHSDNENNGKMGVIINELNNAQTDLITLIADLEDVSTTDLREISELELKITSQPNERSIIVSKADNTNIIYSETFNKYKFVLKSTDGNVSKSIKKFIFTDIDVDGKKVKALASIELETSDNKFFATYGEGGTEEKTFQLSKKTLIDFKSEYIESGLKLREINENIEDYKKKVNKTVDIYTKNKLRSDKLYIQTIIYYVLFGLFTLVNISVMIFEQLDGYKHLIIIVMIGIVISMIMYTSFNKESYIEPFTNRETVNIQNIDIPDNSTASRDNVIQKHTTIFNTNILTYLSNAIVYIPSIETMDLYSKITYAIKKEKQSFTNIEDAYFLRSKQAKESTNLLKHDLISTYSVMNLISYLYLIATILYFLYLVHPEGIKFYLFIAFIWYFFIIWIYYVNVEQPVRVNSSNKYWIKPAEKVLIDAGL